MGQRRGPAVLLLALGEGIPGRGSGRGGGTGWCLGCPEGGGDAIRCPLLPSFPPSPPRSGSPRRSLFPALGWGCRCPERRPRQCRAQPGGGGGSRLFCVERALAEQGHPGAEVGSVRTGAGAHLSPRCWQGTWPGCWQPDPPVPMLTGASRTASSSWGTAWPRTRRRRASSCRGCTESAGEYGARPAWLLPLPPESRAGTHTCAPDLAPVSDRPSEFLLSIHPSIPPSLTCLPLDFVSLVPSDPECLQPGVGLEGPDPLCTPGNLPWSSGFRPCPSQCHVLP